MKVADQTPSELVSIPLSPSIRSIYELYATSGHRTIEDVLREASHEYFLNHREQMLQAVNKFVVNMTVTPGYQEHKDI